MSGREPTRQIRASIVSLCRQLKDNAVSLMDAVALPDFILNSPIGMSDGHVSTMFITFIYNFVLFLIATLIIQDCISLYLKKLFY